MPDAEAFVAYFDRFRSPEAHLLVMGGSVSSPCMPADGVHSKFPPQKTAVTCTSAFGSAMPAAEAFTAYFDRCRSLEAHPSIMGGSVSTSCMPTDEVHSKFPPQKTAVAVLLRSDRRKPLAVMPAGVAEAFIRPILIDAGR